MRKITASHIQAKDGVRQSVTFEDGHCVQHTVTRIHHEARRPSRNVQRQDRLGRHVRGGRFQRLKHGLRHALSVSLGVRGQNGMLLRRILEFFVERVMPDVHLVQIRDERSRQTRRRDAQYLYPALGWRPPLPSW